MTEKEYNQADGIRRSALWKLMKSPAHFKWELDHPPEQTPALVFGSAVHCAVLTPEAFESQFWIADMDGRTKEGKAAKQAAMDAGKAILTSEQATAVFGIASAINEDAFARRLLTGQHEVPYYWVDDMTGEACKCRTDSETDIEGQHYIIDLKTCQDASTEGFMRDALKYGYHVQAAMYAEGVRANTGKESAFVFVAVEKDPPYAINILQCDEAFMLHGMDEYRFLMGLFHECKTKDVWPAYCGLDGGINTLDLPAWIKKGVE